MHEHLYITNHKAIEMPEHVRLSRFQVSDDGVHVALTHLAGPGNLTMSHESSLSRGKKLEIIVFDLLKDTYGDPNVRLADYLGYQLNEDGTGEVRIQDGDAEVWSGMGSTFPEAVLKIFNGIQHKEGKL